MGWSTTLREQDRKTILHALPDGEERDAILSWMDGVSDLKLDLARLVGPGVEGILTVARREIAERGK